MKPKVLHEQAMDLSFKAKQASKTGDQDTAYELYAQAAVLESQVAEYYFDKPELEPTRSVLIRSAAFLNLKAGLIEESQKFIFFGLLHLNDDLIKTQLNEALEFSLALKSIDVKTVSQNFGYLTAMRQRSIHYTLEPVLPKFGTAISLETFHDFSENYLKSLKAFAITSFKGISKIGSQIFADIESAALQFQDLVNPIITNSAFGSFKFSIANDYLHRQGESSDLLKLKANIIIKYHDEIFTNPLSDEDIELLKKKYEEEEINEIFRPLAKMKSVGSSYKIGYFDKESLKKVYISPIVNLQKKKLLPVRQISKDDIGILENLIVHKRSSSTGKVSKSIILKEQMKAMEFDIKLSQIEPNDASPILLNEEIVVNVLFNSEKGFTLSFDDLKIEKTDTGYHKVFIDFNKALYDRIIYLCGLKEMNEDEYRDFAIVKRLINNTEALI